MSLSGRANVTFALKMSHLATVPMLLYRGKVTAEHLIDDCGTPLNHHRNKSKVTYHTNTHTQITDKNIKKYNFYAYRVRVRYARGLQN